MKVTTTDSSPAKRLIISLIVDKVVLSAVAAKWEQPGLFPDRWSNLIGGWCVKHYLKYKKPPGRTIEAIFERWANSGTRDKETVKAVENLLTSLSGDYVRLRKSNQSEYSLDVAADYFTAIRAKKLSDEVSQAVERGDAGEATKLIEKFHKVEIGLGAGIDVLEDEGAIKFAFEMKSEPLIIYPGAAGNFLGDSFERNGFIAFEGPEKRGKTFWLLDVAWRGILQKRRVAFFEVGDLSEGQTMIRFGTRAARIPTIKEPYTYPISIEPAGDAATTTAVTEKRTPEKALTWKSAARAFAKVIEKVGVDYPLLKLSTHPARTINVTGIRTILDRWERDGWVPDIIVIDYADILAPISGTADTRDQINASWIAMRALSMQYHCLVVTASQTDAASYDTDIIGMENFSEDKRKRGHTTGTLAINQTDPEKENGVYRLGWVARRERPFDRKKQLHIAGCLALANPMIHASF